MATKSNRSALNIWVAVSVLAVMTFIALTRLHKVVRPETLSKPVQSTLAAIGRAGDYYKAENGVWPESFAELKASTFLEIPPGAEQGWQFSFVGTPPREIVALSTPEMAGGAGQKIHYDLLTGDFSGYGIDSLITAAN
jgi:hypothetical protein